MVIWICPPPHAEQMVHAPVQRSPTINWPDDFGKPPEEPEPKHPSHEDDPSPVYSGILASNVNTKASGRLILSPDSGASGNLYTTVATTWLPVGSPLAMSTHDLYHGERFQPPWAHAANFAPDTKKHLANPSTHKVFQARPGGRGRP